MFIIREVFGWLLVIAGLVLFFLVYSQFLKNRQLFEAGPLTLIGIFVFRAGIHMLKVAVAARICLQTEGRRPRPISHPQR